MRRLLILGLAAATAGIIFSFAYAFSDEAEAQMPPAPCRAAESFDVWLTAVAGDKSVKIAPEFKVEVAKVQGRLSALCTSYPTTEEFQDGSAAVWLSDADAIARDLSSLVVIALAEPMTASDRRYVHSIASQLEGLEAELGSRRAVAYAAVRVETREVVRTVEVPAPPVQASPPSNPCWDTLRASSGQWAAQLYKWVDRYQGSGRDWELANSSHSILAGLARSENDPVPFVAGWLSQYYSIRENERSFFGSGPMPMIARDMEAKLSYCGYPVARHRR